MGIQPSGLFPEPGVWQNPHSRFQTSGDKGIERPSPPGPGRPGLLEQSTAGPLAGSGPLRGRQATPRGPLHANTTSSTQPGVKDSCSKPLDFPCSSSEIKVSRGFVTRKATLGK